MRHFGYGTCCDALRDCFELPNTHFWADDAGVLYLVTGWMESGEGRGEFHVAVLACPFCGTTLQSAELIRDRSLGPG
jgi:hypothetical protein